MSRTLFLFLLPLLALLLFSLATESFRLELVPLAANVFEPIT